TAQLRHFRPDFQIVDLRGNLNTRFRKYEEADWDGMVLAAAGVERLGWGNRIAERIDSEIMLPAVGQGSFGIMCREDDRHILEKIARINHRPSQLATIAERALLRTLEG
ncbi:MAG: hydroxymethylbilane synthase, partial [Calditrichaeota bacterium]|nr:hydroxymethylbilane synthase [Calditrichota bacterium]